MFMRKGYEGVKLTRRERHYLKGRKKIKRKKIIICQNMGHLVYVHSKRKI